MSICGLGWIPPPRGLSAVCDIIVMGFRLLESEDNKDGDCDDDEEPLQEQEAPAAGEFLQNDTTNLHFHVMNELTRANQ